MVASFRILAGPLLWAALFSAIYALHGLGCALDWPLLETGFGPLHPLSLQLLWGAGLLIHLALVIWNKDDRPRIGQWVRAGNWIGLVASAVTLLPVIATSTCGPVALTFGG